MKLLKAGEVVSDTWTSVEADDVMPSDGPVIVPLARWRAERAALIARNAPLGLRLASDEPPAEIRDDLGHFDLIALEFPIYRDGRAYSYARLLRERYGFKGELRAVGNILFDQLLFMHRSGFDAFEVEKDNDATRFQQALSQFTVRFQPAGDTGASTVMQLRHLAGRNVADTGRRV